LLVSRGDRDLDKVAAGIAAALEHGRTKARLLLALAEAVLTLVQEGEVNLAGRVVVEAMLQRMVQVIQVQVLGAAMIGAIEKRTMLAALVHVYGNLPCALSYYRPLCGWSVNGLFQRRGSFAECLTEFL